MFWVRLWGGFSSVCTNIYSMYLLCQGWLVTLIFIPMFTCDPCTSTDYYSTWMADLHAKSLSVTPASISPDSIFSNQPLNKLLFAGSHDAGLFTVTKKSALGVGFPDNFFLAQSRPVAKQVIDDWNCCRKERQISWKNSDLNGDFR